jgi:iron complex outermembrane receptor protein
VTATYGTRRLADRGAKELRNLHSRTTLGALRTLAILGVLLRVAVFGAPILGPRSVNAADAQIAGAISPPTSSTSQDQSPNGEATTAGPNQSPSPSTQGTTRPDNKKRGVKPGDAESPLEEVLVTGTYIRGVAPASPVITITSVDIENSGASTAGEVLRQLPESFAGGQQSTIGTNGFGAGQNLENFNNSDSANLRGFGSDSTLVLINGLRAAVTGIQGSVDISAIPIAAIDHVEIVTDGASALYGSDAVGGVVNFVLKKDYSGADTGAEVGYPTNGGGLSQRYSQLLGTGWGTGSATFAYQYRDQQGLYGDQRNWWTGPNPYSLAGSIHQNSAYLNVSQSVTPDLKVFAQGLYNHTTSFNVVTHAGTVDTDFLDDTGYSYIGAIGATLTLPREWQVTAIGEMGADRYDHHDDEPCCNFDVHVIPTNRLALGELQAEGPLAQLRSGDIRAAIGGGYRHESLDSASLVLVSAARHTSYGYGELIVPLIGKQTAHVGVQELALSLAGRYEDYGDIGSHFSPQVGLTFRPVSALRLRATWNKSFHAPDLYEKYSSYYVLLNFPVEAPGGGMTNALVATGANSSLEPETARAYTFGLDWQPVNSQLRIGATYFNISYSNRILQPIVDLSSALLDPTVASQITLNPSVAAQESLINGTSSVLNVTGAPFNPSATGAIIDDRFVNAAAQTATGADLRATYAIEASAGIFTPFFNGNVLSLRQQLTSAASTQTISGLVFYPPKYKLQGGLSWQQSELGSTVTFNYSANGTDTLIQPQTHVGAWYTLDLQGRYASSASHGPASGLSVRLSILNVFDKDPPVVTGYSYIYDNTQASPYGRIVRLDIGKQF